MPYHPPCSIPPRHRALPASGAMSLSGSGGQPVPGSRPRPTRKPAPTRVACSTGQYAACLRTRRRRWSLLLPIRSLGHSLQRRSILDASVWPKQLALRYSVSSLPLVQEAPGPLLGQLLCQISDVVARRCSMRSPTHCSSQSCDQASTAGAEGYTHCRHDAGRTSWRAVSGPVHLVLALWSRSRTAVRLFIGTI
jgi:hypothetical protein